MAASGGPPPVEFDEKAEGEYTKLVATFRSKLGLDGEAKAAT